MRLTRPVAKAAPLGLVRHLAPERLALYGIGIYLIMFILAPVVITIPLTLEPFLYLFCGYGCIFLGMAAVRDLPKAQHSPVLAPSVVNVWFWMSLTLGIVGIAFKLFDRFSVRAAEVGANVIQEREAMAQAGANGVSVVAAVLYPFCYLVFFLYLARTRGKKRDWRFIAALIISLAPGVIAISMGGRSGFMVSIAFATFCSIYFGAFRIRLRTVIISAVVFLILIVISSVVFVNRMEAVKVDPMFTVYESGYAFTDRPNAWAGAALSGSRGFVFYIYFTVLMLLQYFVHGVFEFVYQYQHFSQAHLWGADTFSAYFKLFHMLGFGRDPFDLTSSVSPRTGIYTTFFGPVFLDFGWWAMPLLALFGAALKKMWCQALQDDYSVAPLYLYLAIVVLFMPVTNLIASAEGMYVISALFLFWFVTAFIPRSVSR